MNVYLDSSALVKGYVSEKGSAEVAHLIGGARVAGALWLAIPETLSAFARGRRSRTLSEEFAAAARSRFLADRENYLWLALDRELAEEAGELAWQHGLRGFDATHLAAGLKWQTAADDFRFATFDKQLARAARAEGLNVWPEGD